MSQSTIKLVNGIFTEEDAKEILFHLIQQKINFHNQRNFSVEERTGQKDGYSTIRIAELQAAKTTLRETLEQANLMGKNVKVSCDLKLELVSEPSTLVEYPRVSQELIH